VLGYGRVSRICEYALRVETVVVSVGVVNEKLYDCSTH
jgi:hypothetical protein